MNSFNQRAITKSVPMGMPKYVDKGNSIGTDNTKNQIVGGDGKVLPSRNRCCIKMEVSDPPVGP